jgi:hypothetical protein
MLYNKETVAYTNSRSHSLVYSSGFGSCTAPEAVLCFAASKSKHLYIYIHNTSKEPGPVLLKIIDLDENGRRLYPISFGLGQPAIADVAPSPSPVRQLYSRNRVDLRR